MYPAKSNMLQAFGTIGPNVVSSTGVMAHRYTVSQQVTVKRLAYLVTTQSTVTAAVIAVELRPTPGSATGDSVIGTLTIPTSAAIGSFIYKDVAGVVVPAGSEIAFNVTTASTAGGGVPLLVCEEDPETAANNSAMIASA